LKSLRPALRASAAGLAAGLACAGAAQAQSAGSLRNAGAGAVDYSHAEVSPQADCTALKTLVRQVEDAPLTVVSAELVPARGAVPAFCRVFGVIAPEIQFEVALPTAWNRRLYMRGNGGYAGERLDDRERIDLRDRAVSKGFVAAQTNTGHDGAAQPLASFAHNDLAKLTDYSFRAVHLTAQAAKDLAAAYYARPPAYSYFDGCSTGGRQALMSAQRYPGDFDGIAAGAPVLNFTGTQYWGVWNAQHLARGPFSFAQIADVGRRIMDKCDAVDGLKDGLITEPRACPFDPAKDLPRGGANGYSDAQVAALQGIYGGMKSNGRSVFPGVPLGIESPDPKGESGWANWYVAGGTDPAGGQPTPAGKSRQLAFGEAFIQYFADQPAAKPNLDWRSFDFDKDYRQDSFVHRLIDATDPDLKAFKSRGGKLVMYFGWADPALNPNMGVEYYEAVQRTTPEAGDFFRLFMAPGMWHCGGGLGPDLFDPVSAVIDWVEAGKAPDRLMAEQRATGPGGRSSWDGALRRTRPLCPYPQVARYDGRGDPNQAASFRCAAPARVAGR
jgi:feruloyl esterase